MDDVDKTLGASLSETVKKGIAGIKATNPFQSLVSGFEMLENGAKRFSQVANKLDEIEKEEKMSVAELMQKEALRTGAKPKKRFVAVVDEEHHEGQAAAVQKQKKQKSRAAKGRDENGLNGGNLEKILI